ncbi:MAG: DNA repair protein RadC [Pseudomonadota bacterium]|nr:DNA repair protein RadC [Pseudomonadota bacterium]
MRFGRIGWPWRRAAAVEIPAEPEAVFDASIDLDPDLGVSAERVRVAIAALPGAGWISVEPHRGARLEVRVFEAGSGFEAAGAIWERIKGEIEGLIRGLGGDSGWASEAPSRMGFAEAAPQFEASAGALEQLAALAAANSSPARQTKRKRAEPALVPPAVPSPVSVPGPSGAADDEDVFRLMRLLALVLPVDGKETAAAAVRRFGSFAAVLAAPEAELRRVPGFGVHCIAAVKLVHAAAIRHARAGLSGRPVLDDPKRLMEYLSAALARERIEQFRILFLDADGMLKADEVQAQGTVNHTPVYPREVVRRALALEATSLILVHNHPSGDPAPSRDDIEMTRQVQQAASVLRIGLRDHVIIGNGRCLSFREEGLLD